MKELIIRKAEEKDLNQIVAIENQCFASPWSYESLRHDILDNKLAFYVVGEIEGQVCGYVGLWNVVGEGHITNVAVLPEWRRKHIGSAMLKAIIDACQKWGITDITLEVRPTNKAAIDLYKTFGFREFGRRKGYYIDNGEDALIMWRGKTDEE